jgi:hypothetical protein
MRVGGRGGARVGERKDDLRQKVRRDKGRGRTRLLGCKHSSARGYNLHVGCRHIGGKLLGDFCCQFLHSGLLHTQTHAHTQPTTSILHITHHSETPSSQSYSSAEHARESRQDSQSAQCCLCKERRECYSRYSYTGVGKELNWSC